MTLHTQIYRPIQTNKHIIILFLLLIIGVFRIISTYNVFNQTADEPLHVARGMEWLEKGTYSHLEHPPLGPILVGIGPFLDGVRINWTGDKHLDGNQILYYNGAYFRNLSLARLGTLVFFLLTGIIVWLWALELYGPTSATLAALIFTTLPFVLGHSGLATTDMAVTATLTAALYCFCLWIDEKSLRLTILLGLAVGLTIISKFSALLFLPVCIISLLALRWMVGLSARDKISFHFMEAFKSCLLIGIVAGLVVWAGYRFSLGSLAGDCSLLYGYIKELTRGFPLVSEILPKIKNLKIIPAHELVSGFLMILTINTKGHAPYFLGSMRWQKGGTWLFFPVVFVIKSPIPFLILTFGSVVPIFMKLKSVRDWKIAAPLVAAIAIFISVLPSDINAGLRHILPVFPLMSIVAGFSLDRLFNMRKRWRFASVAATVLLLWQIASGVLCHPDYLSYFNEFANRHPERFVVDSDLDWGQDLARLAEVLKEKKVTHFSLAYFGSADINRHGLPKFQELEPREPTTGWVAVSLFYLKATRYYKWLSAYKPVATAGKSIWIYYVPPKGDIQEGEEPLS